MTSESLPDLALMTPAHLQPGYTPSDGRSCWTCAHSIGWTEDHVFCQLHERVHVTPCGLWERGAGCDPRE